MKKLIIIILLLLCLTANVSQSQSFKMFGQLLNTGHWSTDGLVFYWRGIEAVEAVDESPYGTHGTIIGPTWVGEGLSFDKDNNDYVSLGKDIGFNDGLFTFITKFVIISGTTNKSITGGLQNGCVNIRVNSGEKVQLQAQGRTLIATADTTLSLNRIYTSAVTYDGTTVKFYLDGVADGVTVNAQVFDSRDTLIGRGWSTEYFDGTIFCISYYNRVLSLSEIAALYINSALPMQQDPIWLLQPSTVPSGIIPIIQAHNRRRAG